MDLGHVTREEGRGGGTGVCVWGGGGGVGGGHFRSGQIRARNQDWLMSGDGWADLGQVRICATC